MDEIFNLSRASLGIYGVCPVRLTAVSQTGANEITATSAILSRFPNGDVRMMQKSECLTTKMGAELPRGGWVKMMANATSEWVTNEWLLALAEDKDPLWKEYLRVKGPLTWIEQEEPELEILRVALRSNASFLNDLAKLASKLPQPKAKQALKQAVDLGLKLRLH